MVLLSLIGAKNHLRLDTDWLVLFRNDRPEIAKLRYWRKNLPGSKDMAVILSGGDLRQREEAADRLGAEFAQYPALLEAPLEAVETKPFVASGLFFLPLEQLQTISKDCDLILEAVRHFEFESGTELPELVDGMARSEAGSKLLTRGLEAFVAATSSDKEEQSQSEILPDLEPQSEQMRRSLGDFSLIPKKAYVSLDEGKTLLVLVAPKIGDQALEASAPAVSKVRAILRELRQEYASVTFSLTGEPVLVVDERKTIANDSVRGTICSFILVSILFQFGFREFLRPFLALSSLIVGLLWTLGVVSIGIGHLNFITITYVPILIGIGLDFGIHMAFRYYEHRSCCEPERSIQCALCGAGKDTLYGALTTSASFAVLAAIGFRGVSELGTIALAGVLLCQLASCTFLPALLAMLESMGANLPSKGIQEFSQTEQRLLPWDRALLIGTLVFTLFCASLAPGVGFNVHLLKMQNPKLESVQTELRLVAEGKSSVLTALIACPDLAETRKLEAKLRSLSTVAEVISLAAFLPEQVAEKQSSVTEIVSNKEKLIKILGLLHEMPVPATQDALRLLKIFEELSLDPQRAEAVALSVGELKEHLGDRGPGPIIDALESMRQNTLQKLQSFVPVLESQEDKALDRTGLPESLSGRLFRKDGQFVLRVFPKVDIWQPQNLRRFLDQVRGVSPDVSGEPVLIELFERLVLDTHWRGLGLSILAMVVVLWFILRQIDEVVLAAMPTVLSLILVMGLMSLFRWDFNPANFVAIPMLLGIGSVFALHSVLRMRELGHERLLSCSTGPAIMLSAATSMAGFASLGLAEHQGIASLGWLVTLGLFLNALLSLLVLPAWLRFQKGEKAN